MFNKLINVTLVGFLINRYGAMIVSTLVLFAYFWVVGMIHQDYLEYLQLRDSTHSAGLSFVFKWLAFILGITIYWLFNSYIRKRADRRKNAQTSAALQTVAVRAGRGAGDANSSGGADDPFDEIRHKEKLRSRADLIIESKPSLTSKKQ